MVSARQAFERLRDGNRRFASDAQDDGRRWTRPAELADGQSPYAIILGCSDSRVPAEIVFDQGLGDLFVIRVAGNIVAPSLIGSIEFAAARFGTRLVVVLGHSNCGVIQEALQQLQKPNENRSQNLRSIVDFVRPSVASVLADGRGEDLDTVIEQAVRANVRASAEHLRHGSEILEDLERNDGLVIVGAEYSLETGLVDFFDGVPEETQEP